MPLPREDGYVHVHARAQHQGVLRIYQEQFLYSAGETYFLYGQFDQARKRLYPIYQAQCGKTKFGYLAWERLLTMANKEHKIEEGRQHFKSRVTPEIAATNLFERALVDILLKQRGQNIKSKIW